MIRLRACRIALLALLLLAFPWAQEVGFLPPTEGRGETRLLSAPPLPGLCSESDRFGVWAVERLPDAYDVAPLHAGWYSWWTVQRDPPRPAGLRAAQLVRLSADGPYPHAACGACPPWDEVRAIARANPGSLWLIGNEPDRQDLVTAARYAELYDAFYTFLKAEDPTCQVAVGGVVQPTPIRLQYLDLVLAAYAAGHGGAHMPVDVWNVHNYVLREGVTGWGCGIPPGTDPALARDYGIQDHDRIDLWAAHLVDLRAWMAANGYRDRPLVISEFGILMPDLYGYDSARVRAFLHASFDWLMTASDPEAGYPADGDRLVQAWIWYSLDEAGFEGWPSWNHLFDPATRAITPLGLDFGAYTAPLAAPFAGSLDLQLTGLHLSRPQPGAGGLFSVALTAQVANAGAVAAEGAAVRFERDGAPAGEVGLPRLEPGAAAEVTWLWTDLPVGRYAAAAAVLPGAPDLDCDPSNNRAARPLLLPRAWQYLPLVAANSPEVGFLERNTTSGQERNAP